MSSPHTPSPAQLKNLRCYFKDDEHLEHLKQLPSIDRIEFGIAVAELTRFRSPEVHLRVGCFLQNHENRSALGIGYNGFLAGKFVDDKVISNRTRSSSDAKKFDYLQHAEPNAIHFATQLRLDQAIAFVSCLPCEQCSIKLLQKNVSTIIFNICLDKYATEGPKYFKKAGAVLVSSDSWIKAKQKSTISDSMAYLVEWKELDFDGSNRRLSWHDYFLGVAQIALLRSCSPPSLRAGCVIVKNKRVISIGYSGFPQNLLDKDVDEEFMKKLWPLEIDCVRNALCFVTDQDRKGCKVYTTRLPTEEAVRELIQVRLMFIRFPFRKIGAKTVHYSLFLSGPGLQFTASEQETSNIRHLGRFGDLKLKPHKFQDMVRLKIVSLKDAEAHYKNDVYKDDPYRDEVVKFSLPNPDPEATKEIQEWVDKTPRKLNRPATPQSNPPGTTNFAQKTEPETPSRLPVKPYPRNDNPHDLSQDF